LAQSTESSGGQSLSFREQLEKERRTLQEELSKLGHLKGGHPSSKDTLAGFFTDHSNQQHKTACQLEDSNFLQEEQEDIASLNSNDSHTTQGVVAPLVGNENNLYQPQNLPPYIPDEVHPFLEFPVMKSVEHIPNIGDPCNYPANHPLYQTQKLDNMTCSMLCLSRFNQRKVQTAVGLPPMCLYLPCPFCPQVFRIDQEVQQEYNHSELEFSHVIPWVNMDMQRGQLHHEISVDAVLDENAPRALSWEMYEHLTPAEARKKTPKDLPKVIG
jgi:hypothetical protein